MEKVNRLFSSRRGVASTEHRVEFGQTHRLHSLILPVRSSSCLDCLLESLILSIFWNPFLQQASARGVSTRGVTAKQLAAIAAKIRRRRKVASNPSSAHSTLFEPTAARSVQQGPN